MNICYVDEAGDGQRPSRQFPEIPPVLVVCGLVLRSEVVSEMTREFLDVKARFHPGKAGQLRLDGILYEVKGSSLRRDVRSGAHRRVRAAFGFLDHITKLLNSYDAGIVGRVWNKDPSCESDERSMYTFSIQDIAKHFQHHLKVQSTNGLIICDGRGKSQNASVAHSVFTKMFKQTGNSYPRIVEMPVFGHSDNHAGLQLADIVASAIVFPIACRTYCRDYLTGVHVHPAYDRIKERYGAWLQDSQIRYYTEAGKPTGGLIVSDPVGHKHGGELFR